MEKDLFTRRLISLLAVQQGLAPASAIGLSIKQESLTVKNRLRVENFAMPEKRRSHAKPAK